MEHNSNKTGSLSRKPIDSTYGSHSTVLTEEIVPAIDTAHNDRPKRSTALFPEPYDSTGSDHVCGGCESHSSTSTQTQCAVADQTPVQADLGQQEASTCYPMSELDEITDHEQSGHRLLDERHPDDPSQPHCGVKSSRQSTGTFWLPFCLRRTTSLIFLVAFALKAAILEILFALSQRNSGLSQGIPFMRYLWSYGTTGILTLTAALWHRLDYETKASAPWLRAHPITSSKSALLVDYIDAWTLLIPFRALRNRDYEVVYSSTISLLLQVLIILSTSLFTLVPTNVINNAEPIFLTSRFVDDPARLSDSESLLPYYITMGTEASWGNVSKMMGSHLTYPEGCTNEFAYETFSPVSSNLEQVETTVHGLALGLACETASVGKSVTMPQLIYLQGKSSYEQSASFEVNYQGCQKTIQWDIFVNQSDNYVWSSSNETFREHGMMLRAIPGFARNQCNSLDQADHRLVFLSAEVEMRPYNQSIIIYGREAIEVNFDVTLLQAIALVCTPYLEQPLLNVSRNNGGVQSVTRRSGSATDSLSVIHPWDFISFLFDVHIMGEDTSNITVGNKTVWADARSKLVLGFCGQSCLQAPGIFNDATLLQDILAKFLANFAATTANSILAERTNITSTGTSSSILVRLWVQPIACQAMAAILVLLILIVVGFQFEQKQKLTRRINPGSIAATAILAGQATISKFPKDLGSANSKGLHKALERFLYDQGSSSSYPFQHTLPRVEGKPRSTSTNASPAASSSPAFQNPLPLRPVSQTALIFIIVGCATTLMISLRKSADEQGLGDTPDSKYLLYAWTIVPAAILTIISWWLSSIDTQVRLLAPCSSLKRNKCSYSVLRTDLLRGLIPFVLYQELRTSNFVATSTTLAALLGASLTTVSAPMFHVMTYPISSPIELSQDTFFMSPPPKPGVVFDDPFDPLNRSLWEIGSSWVGTSRLSSLILETNLSYPQGSYQDLIFPTFSMTPFEIENTSHTINASSATVKVTAPVLRPRLSCRVYSPSDIAAAYVPNAKYGAKLNNRDQESDLILVNVTTELCGDQQMFPGHSAFGIGNLSRSLFASATKGSNNLARATIVQDSCSHMLYIWGYSYATPGPVTTVSAVGCNSSVELVDAEFSLLWPDLSLDLADAPKAIESTVRTIRDHGAVDSFWSDEFYTGLASLPVLNEYVFDPFFQQLVTSRYAIPISAIGDPTQADVVLNAIRFQHGIIEAQVLSSNYRVDVNSPRVKENPTAVLTPTIANNSTSNDSTSYSATLTYPFGRQRVVQDPTATAILVALLLSISILLIMNRVFGSNEPALPRSPSSVGSVLALLAGGNILEHLYDEGPEPMDWNDVKTRLGEECQIFLGWDPSNTDLEFEQRRFGIWIIK